MYRKLVKAMQDIVGYTPTTGLQFKTKVVEGVGVFIVPVPRNYVAD